MRKRKVISHDSEDIISYSFHVDGHLQILVGAGDIVDGKFIPSPSQNYEVIDVIGEDFDNFMLGDAERGRPPLNFRKDDLWELVDNQRNIQKG